MTPQQKINTAFLGALLIIISLMFWAQVARQKQDARVLAAAIRSERAVAVDSANRIRLAPVVDSIKRELGGIKTQQIQLQVKILLNTKRNESLNKQLDSVDAVLGLRPEF